MRSIKNLKFRDIKFSDRFNKQLSVSSDEIIATFWETFFLFLEDPNHSVLRNHPLKGKFFGYRSMNVTEDWRALFKETKSGKQKIVTFYFIGTHEELYG